MEKLNFYTYPCKIDRVVDGDTIDLNVELGFHIKKKIRVRLIDFDAPEMRGEEKEEGKKATNFLKSVLTKMSVDEKLDFYVTTKKTGRWGRWLGELFNSDGESINSIMIKYLERGE